ncbi:MAG: phospholipid carrier-dependent glycosyltransferase [Clostridia bacterium]|nr:phospholipid carrier-dependent glycosyltransferase [Clostridia bacterium]
MILTGNHLPQDGTGRKPTRGLWFRFSTFQGQKCRIGLFLILLHVLLLLCAGSAAENLLANGSFEETDAQGNLIGWSEDAYILEEGYTVFSVQAEEGNSDNHVASIRNIGANDARFSQTVSVEPESLYRFSGLIKAKNVQDGRGANLSIEGLYVFSESVFDTDGVWQRIEWYGETGEDQTTVTLFARLGGYSGESTGQAWFDDLRLEEVDAVPGDGIASRWYTQKQIGVYEEDEEDLQPSGASAAWPRLILLSLFYTIIALTCLQHLRARAFHHPEASADLSEDRKGKAVFIAGLLAALLLRMVISFYVSGYMVDVNCFLSWGGTMADVGPLRFYPATSFCDYPPAYTYILGLNALVCKWIPGLSEGAVRVVYRFIPALCDVLSCMVLERFFARRASSLPAFLRRGAILLLAFHPVTIMNSAAWGQMDSALALLILLVAVWAIEGRWHLALPCYMLAVLVKPQALMLGFLGLTAFLLCWIRQKSNRHSMLWGIGAAFAVLLIIVVPFSIHQDPFWIVSQYSETLASYPYATVNTANFYYLFDGNWDAIQYPAAKGAILMLAALSLTYGTYYFFQGRKYWKKIWIEGALAGLFSLFFILCAAGVTGASWSIVGIGAMAFAFLIVLSLYLRKKEISFLPYLGGLLFMILYVFGVKMHERYIFPAFLLLALAYGIQRDRRILVMLLGLTVTSFLNEGIVLDNSIRLGSAMGHLNQDTHILAQLLSLLNCMLTVYAVYAGVKMALPAVRGDEAPAPFAGGVNRKEKGKTIENEAPDGMGCAWTASSMPTILRDWKTDNRLHWRRKDTLLLTGITMIYAVISLVTLGSTKAPQTAWTSSEYTENVIFDLGESQENFAMLYFARVSRYDFSVAVSDDGMRWEDETWAQMDQGQCWKWKYVTESTASASGTRSYGSQRHWFSGRYVRITAHQINLALCEVLFRDDNGRQLPIVSVVREGGDETSPLYSDPENLTDEQNTFEGLPVYVPSDALSAQDESNPRVAQPSWWNSTYFDEIYHARTAWEFLTASAPYETSHPPLGKVLMSWGVAVFGMTPFGWRFAGALAGILMLPGIYLVVKQMTKSTSLSGFACGLMALDCMHLTQTQIATIDSFPVLFILFAFFFMLRFLQSDWRKEKHSRVLADLGLGGLCMSLAIASKWIGIYAGAGLGILFFWHGWRILSLDRQEKGGKEAAGKSLLHAFAFRQFFHICLFCVLFYVVLPVIVYLLSYLPYFAYRHLTSLSAYLSAVADSQLSMFQYHATPGLGMDHPFYSPWYEWPIIEKPMFYATKQYVFADDLSSSIFCIGNPILWWSAIPAMAACFWMWARNREESLYSAHCFVSVDSALDTNLVFLLVGFLAEYLPWMLVPRGTYIYHYFASIPFLIFSITVCFEQLHTRFPRFEKAAQWVFLAMALLAMILFFPYVTGIYAPVSWLDAGRSLLKIWY